MNCEEFKRELQTAVENRVIPDFSAAREHLKHCEHCRALSEDYHIVERAVEEWSAVDDNAPDLSGRVLAVLANEQDISSPARPVSPAARIVPVLVGLSLVALLFLAIYISQSADQKPAGVADDPPDFDPEVNTPAVDMEVVWRDTKAAYESLVHRVTEPFEPFKDVVPSTGSDEEETGPSEEIQEEPSDSVPPQLEGLQTEFKKSLGFLTAAFPSQSPVP